jgi:pyruvate/2-oxoglutarate dehydrogenase complex dihydrolipoamide dehydrogenase (E3) component
MTTKLTPDICVIGAGSGGLSVAAAAAAFGASVVLIERGKMGGDCLNFGCVPSKSLIAAASHAHAMRHGAGFGIANVEPEINFAKVAEHVQSVIEAISPNDSVARFTAMGVKVIQAEGKFIDRRTVQAGDTLVRARRFVIATGSSAAIPPIAGLDGVPYLTNETIFDLKRRPNHLVVIGGGPIGMELGQAFRRLGSQVTIVEAATCLAREDAELAGFARRGLIRDGVTLSEHTQVSSIELRGKTGMRVYVQRDGDVSAIDASHVLVAAGRRPNLAALDLDKARVKYDKSGIKVGHNLTTSNARVYAIGDVSGAPQLTSMAGYHAGIVIRRILFRLNAKADPAIVPRVTFTQPELAQVGLTEGEALAAGHKISILRWPVSENDRAQASLQTEGLIKLIAGPGERILGVSIAAENAGELINLYALALSKQMKLRDLTGFVPAYPTTGEIGKRAAITYFASATRKPSVRRLVRFLRIFG